MVSTEENSSSDVTAARNALLQGGMTDAALSALIGVAPWANPAKPIEAFSYGLGEPAMAELAEAALAYTHDESHATAVGTKAPANLTLVTDNGAEVGGDEAAEMPQDAESVAIRAEAAQLLSEIGRMDSEVKADLGPEIALLKAALQTGRASGVDFERIRDRITAAATNAEAAKVETPEQKRERLWNEIEALNKEADELFNQLDSTEEEKKVRKRLQEAIANETDPARRLALQRELNDLDKRVADRNEGENPPGSAKHDASLGLGNNVDERQRKVDEARRDSENHVSPAIESKSYSAQTSDTSAQSEANKPAVVLTPVTYEVAHFDPISTMSLAPSGAVAAVVTGSENTISL